MKKSLALTKGKRWSIFRIMVLSVLVNAVGICALLIGLFFTIPLTFIALALLYKKLAAAPAPAEESPAEVVDAVEVPAAA